MLLFFMLQTLVILFNSCCVVPKGTPLGHSCTATILFSIFLSRQSTIVNCQWSIGKYLKKIHHSPLPTHHGILSSAIFNDNPNTPADANITQSFLFTLNSAIRTVAINRIVSTTAICPTSRPTLNPNNPQPID